MTATSWLPPLFADLPAGLAESFLPHRPWQLLGEPLAELLAALPSERIETALQPEAHLSGDRVVIGKGTRIAPGATLEGPVFIGENVDIRCGAYVRGGAWIGDGCTVGANTEVKRSILLPTAKAPHLNYVGDSILGRDVNLGAGTVLSNFRHDGGQIRIARAGGEPFETGRRKLGAILGDEVKTGCNSVLHPGVIVGRGTEIYPLVQLRSGAYPADSIVKLLQEINVVTKRR
ncbi:MAG: glucose-1-phosphate thymidylyltransferase [Acidobacteriota bacterium]|nr:glucose-1-phosphate thymidylyltransferase [Acidobacteriota bacterium]